MSERFGKAEREALNDLARVHGKLTPALVLNAAADEESVLHKHFTWDDSEAAHAHRLNEARDLIVQVRVRMVLRENEPPVSVRAFVSLAGDRVDGQGYRPIEVVMNDASMREQLLATAIGELNSLQRKYDHLSELAKVFDAVRAVKTRHKKAA